MSVKSEKYASNSSFLQSILCFSTVTPHPRYPCLPCNTMDWPLQREWDLALAYDMGLKLGVTKVRLRKFKKLVGVEIMYGVWVALGG